MAINFPTAPTNGQAHTEGGISWIFNSAKGVWETSMGGTLPAHTHTFLSLTSKPTTIAGYGITDFNSLGDARWSLLGHAHTSANITDFAEAVDDRVFGLLVAGTNITFNYNDAANTFTINASGGGGGDVVGPASVTDDLPAIFDGITGKLIKQKTYAAFKTLLALVKGDVGLGNVDNTTDAGKPVSTAQQTALDLKANLAGPTLTGVPAAPTAAQHTDTTQIATTAFVMNEVAKVPQNAQTGTTYGPVAADNGKMVTLSNAAGITVTISSATHAAEDRIDFLQKGAGQVTFVGSGVTINSFGNKLKLSGQYSGATLWFESATVAYLVGDLAT